jgi:hypothetical protein
MLPLEVVGPGGSLSTATIAAPYGRDASRRESWQAATATEGGGAWRRRWRWGEKSQLRTVATGQMRRSSIGWGTAGGGSGALWNDSRTRAVKGGRTLGEKHATFTADFRAYRAISGDPHRIKISSQYMPLYFLLNKFVSKSYYKLNIWLLLRCYFRVTFNCLKKYEKRLSQIFFFIRLNCLVDFP